eukprot:scaffold310_cov307-Pinguiococcus_pyrenoidosus.AAC.19
MPARDRRIHRSKLFGPVSSSWGRVIARGRDRLLACLFLFDFIGAALLATFPEMLWPSLLATAFFRGAATDRERLSGLASSQSLATAAAARGAGAGTGGGAAAA